MVKALLLGKGAPDPLGYHVGLQGDIVYWETCGNCVFQDGTT